MRLPVPWPLVPVLPFVVACRFGFEDVPGVDAGSDAAPPPPVLPCAAPPQFSMVPMAAARGATGVITSFAAAATETGYYALAVDGVGDLRGFSYAFDGEQLASRKINVPVFSGGLGSAAIAAIPNGDGVMAAMVYGDTGSPPAPAGTALLLRDAQLGSLGDPQMHPSWLVQDTSIARLSDGTLALLGKQSGQVTVELLTPTGADTTGVPTTIGSTDTVGFATIAASDPGFVVSWHVTGGPTTNVYAEVLNKRLEVVTAVVVNDAATSPGNEPHAAATEDRVLVAWWSKVGGGDDAVWISLRDRNLAPIVPAGSPPGTHSIVVGTHAKSARVIAGKDEFLVVWQDTSPTGAGPSSRLGAARVRSDGTFTPLTVRGGYPFIKWDLVTRAGQPALVWLEDSSVPTLWFNPLCN